MIYIVGIGPGSKDYILPKAIITIENSEVVIGFRRALESLYFIDMPKKEAKDLSEIISFINSCKAKDIAIVASGDPCFYGILNYIKANYKVSFEVVPGISSFQYLMAKLNKAWQGSFLGSLHGREEDFIEKVGNSYISIWLTDKTNTPKIICKRLYEKPMQCKVYIGENLSYEDEKITVGIPEELMDKEYGDLSVVVIENDLYKG
ncbi:precorrin-6y C5,15-methyltransferase (decarboxylating), CbiE subunit [Clostridiales bacterium oral taxon 876 str. F0540]|nr:precorrin-6y C5,15-methyltransferase (decarboxylating), CbiE subunit [Clostridiales bacterium oral taxon 876 str. F0540]